jgi:cell wall-active antibiotic response 4TMS protein YvqF
MKCAVHAEVDATGFCRNCGKALCAECKRDVRGILYCEACLADLLTKPPQPPTGGPSPALAAVLGFVPGLGAVYNGEYTKAAIHVVIFVAFIGALNSGLGDPAEAMLGVLLTAFIFYMAIDAYRTAKARLLGQPPPMTLGEVGGDKPIGPLILIGLGVLFLLQKMHVLHLARVFEFWPVFLIVVGVLLLWKRMRPGT